MDAMERAANVKRAAAWNAANPEKHRQHNAVYAMRRDADPVLWARKRISLIRYRSSRDGIHFGLAVDDLLAAIPANGLCPALGVPLTFGVRGKYAPSVDRIVPSTGYVVGNIAIISCWANFMKRDATDPTQLRMVADYMERQIEARK